MAEATSPVTIRLDRDLHRRASALVRATGGTFRELIETGLRQEINNRMGDSDLAAVVETLAAYNQKVSG